MNDLIQQYLNLPIILALVLFDVVMKSIAMWKSARNSHLVWFIFLAILNTVGILPIIYIILDKKGLLNPNKANLDID